MQVKIRPLQESDAYISVKWRNIPEIWKLTGSAPDRKIKIEDELRWIRKVISDKTCRRFAILADGVYVGNTYLTDIKNSEAEYHIFIGEREYWGKGIARKASELIIEYAKREIKLNKLKLEVNEDNVAALKLYNSMGFRAQGAIENKFIKMSLNL